MRRKYTENAPRSRISGHCRHLLLQQADAGLFACGGGLIVPDGRLHLADVCLSEQQHGQTRLTDAAADRQRQLPCQQHLVIGQLAAVIAAGDGQLAVEALGIDADAHGRELKRAAEQVIPEQDIPVHRPVVIVRRAAVMRLAGAQCAADADDERRVYAVLYNLSGQAATPLQFVVTDSAAYLFRGALYFDTPVRRDSVAPIVDYITDDVVRLIETLQLH